MPVTRRTLATSEVVPGIRVNPGAGDVTGSTLAAARRNMRVYIVDAGYPEATVRRKARADEGGRFAFTVKAPGVNVEVLMPGWPLAEVRYLGLKGQNPWDFPRLYVDGSSWLWKYAIDISPGEEAP